MLGSYCSAGVPLLACPAVSFGSDISPRSQSACGIPASQVSMSSTIRSGWCRSASSIPMSALPAARVRTPRRSSTVCSTSRVSGDRSTISTLRWPFKATPSMAFVGGTSCPTSTFTAYRIALKAICVKGRKIWDCGDLSPLFGSWEGRRERPFVPQKKRRRPCKHCARAALQKPKR